MSKKLVIIILGLVIIAVVLAVLFMPQKATTPGTDESNTTPPADTQSSSSSENTSDDTAAATVEIDDFAFVAQTVNVKVGDTVTWTNKDSVGHNLKADELSEAAPDSDTLNQDESYSFTFTKAGTYGYYCKPHPEMKGTVVVTE